MPTASVAPAVTMPMSLCGGLLGARDEHHHEHADERQEGADAQQPVVIGEWFHG